VWSAEEGYPGHPDYREFYRDVGYDAPFEHVRPYVQPNGHRKMTGIKYQRITGDSNFKEWYVPDNASRIAAEHAANFAFNRRAQAGHLAAVQGRPPVIVAPYDAELYGHWWYEGPQFLDDLFRQLHYDQDVVELVTPGDYLLRYPTNQVVTPCASSWGKSGYNEYWVNESNSWIYRHLHAAGERMVELARRFPDAEGLTARALNQAARELLLAQSSDWAFIMTTGTMVPYAERRTNEHVVRFTRIYEGLLDGGVDEEWLREVESQDNLFPELDYRIYAT
jgi:1,4-alpha-glucan branching enzyme